MWSYTLFPAVVNMSITASVAVCAVLLARLALRRAPRIFSYVLWAVVLFRLLCPVSLSSPLSALNLASAPVSAGGTVDYIPPDIVHTPFPAVALPLPGLSLAINQALPQEEEQLAADPLEAPVSLATLVWLAGAAVMLAMGAASLLRLRRQLTGAVKLRDNIYLADRVSVPFTLGLLRPAVYLPSSLAEEERGYIIAHELTHIRRRDYLWRALAWLALCLHWFNPLVWLAFVLSGRDMELSCDEAVLRRAPGDIRADYCASLLRLAAGRPRLSPAVPPFGYGPMKERMVHIMKFRAPRRALVVAAVILVVVVCAALALNPLGQRENTVSLTFPAYQEGREEYNAALYDHAPFTLTMTLPDGWRAELPPLDQRAATFAFTPILLYDGEELAATVGFNTFELYPDTTPENFHRMVYNQLMLGSGVNWDNDYTVLSDDGTACTASCQVYLQDPVTGAESYVPGLLSYRTDLLVYVAIQFQPGAVTQEELAAMGESISLTPA